MSDWERRRRAPPASPGWAQLQVRADAHHPAAHAPTPWGLEALWLQLEPRLPGLSIEVVARCESTNTALLERLRELNLRAAQHGLRDGDLQPMVLVAEHQTQGRGRMGRSWQAAPGDSLTFSLAVPMARADWSGLSLAVGVALTGAMDPHGQRLGVKWPNDVWLRDGSGRKLGGVLIEGVSVGALRVAVIGVGLNVRSPAGVPEAAGLLQAGLAPLPPPALLAQVLPALVEAIPRFNAEGFAPYCAAFAERDLLRGCSVTTSDAACPSGEAVGVREDGALLVRAAGQVHAITSGEVTVRPAP